MNKYIINAYYDFLISLEDLSYWFEKRINNHRKRIDDKYWQSHIYPLLLKREEKLYEKTMEARKNKMA